MPVQTSSLSILQVCITVGISCVVLPKTLGISVELLSLGISVDLPKPSESVLWICPKSSEISVELPNVLGQATVVDSLDLLLVSSPEYSRHWQTTTALVCASVERHDVHDVQQQPIRGIAISIC